MGRDKIAPLTPDLEANLKRLLIALNIVRRAYGSAMVVSSGFRPAAINTRITNAAKNSAHMSCQACDFRDPNGNLARWCINNLDILKQAGLYLEDPRWTSRKNSDGSFSGWVHLQIRRPGSGNRVFTLHSKPTNPDFWDGKYDLKHN